MKLCVGDTPPWPPVARLVFSSLLIHSFQVSMDEFVGFRLLLLLSLEEHFGPARTRSCLFPNLHFRCRRYKFNPALSSPSFPPVFLFFFFFFQK